MVSSLIAQRGSGLRLSDDPGVKLSSLGWLGSTVAQIEAFFSIDYL